MKIFKDQLNRKIKITNAPKRIVSLVPSQTELLVDLGLRDKIVGVTKFCVHPKDLRKETTIVGGTKTIKVDKIKALNPDIILCNKEENNKEIIEALIDVAPIYISDIYNLEEAFEMIYSYGEIFEVEKKASELIENIKNERNSFQEYKNQNSTKKAAYFIWKKPWMVAASNTFIDVMISEAGFDNVFKTETRYPEISLNNSKLKDVDVLFLSSEPFPFKQKHIEELKLQFPEKEIRIVDGEIFSWYGSRLLNAYKYFKTLH